MERLTMEDIEMIIESLNYTYRAVDECTSYPSYEFKQQRRNEVYATRQKMRDIKKERKNNASKS
jgi:signal recognition particle subunit SEC65